MDKAKTYQRKNYISLDVVKFGCALIILLYHWASEWGHVPAIVEELFSLYAIVLPIFLTISGYLFFDKVLHVTKEEQQDVLLHQVKRILSVYLLWSIGYILFQIYTWFVENLTVHEIAKDVWGWLTYSTFYTIWFMPALALGLVIVFSLYQKLGLKKTFVVSVVLYVVGTLGLTYGFFGDKIKFIDVFLEWFCNYFNSTRNGIFYTPVFIAIGGLVAQRKERLKLWQSLLGVIVSGIFLVAEAVILKVYVGGTGIDMAIFQIAFSWFALEFVLKLKFDFVSANVSIWMRRISMLLFVSQRYFLSVIPEFFSNSILLKVEKNNILSFSIMVGGTFLLSVAIVQLSKNRLKSLRCLY